MNAFRSSKSGDEELYKEIKVALTSTIDILWLEIDILCQENMRGDSTKDSGSSTVKRVN